MFAHKIHFIGICGVAMSALAIAFQKKRHKKLPDSRLVPRYLVTGSDAGFYPPVSTNLAKNGVAFYPGWHPEKMCQGGKPDLVIVGNVASSTNPEFLFVKENNIPYKSYPEAIAEFFVQTNSIVCAGTYGKTTSTALLTWIFLQARKDMSYMFGGIPINNFDSASLLESDLALDIPVEPHLEEEILGLQKVTSRLPGAMPVEPWSILEGDEYKTSPWDKRPKFALYSPTHLLLTSVSWDHADVYKTEAEYLSTFKNLVSSIPENGLVVGCFEGHNIPQALSTCKANLIIYGETSEADYCHKDVQQNYKGIQFDIVHKNKTYHLKSPLLGDFNAENITGCFALAHQVGIEPKVIAKAITTFQGLKRRLEKRLKSPITLIDDIAHSPAKAKSVLETIRKIYKGKILVVFEPNTGNRKKQTFPQYHNAFRQADQVIIPRLTKLKHDLRESNLPLEGNELSEILSQSHNNTHYFPDDEELVEHIIKNIAKEDVLVFLGSHGFRGMIEKVVERLS